MGELEEAAADALNTLREERQLPVAERISGAHDQDVDEWISWVQKTLAAGSASARPADSWVVPLGATLTRWPEDSAIRVSMERFLDAYKTVDRARRQAAEADHRRRFGIFRGHYVHENRAGVTATHETVWGLLSFFESSANVPRALDEGAKWSRWLSEDHAYWAGNLPHMPPTRKPIALDEEQGKAIAASRVSASVRHAHAYYDAAKQSPNTVRPNLLYYGALALAKSLIWASFQDAPAFHGLSAGKNKTVWIRTDGEFAAFHDVVCTIPAIYAGSGKGGREVELDALLANVHSLQSAIARTYGNGWKYAGRMTMASGDRYERRLDDVAGNQVPTHSLAVDLAALFFLSNWSRYRPVEWEEVLRGEKSGEVHIYLTFLDHIALEFPLQVANFLMGVRNVFSPALTDEEFKEKVNRALGDTFHF